MSAIKGLYDGSIVAYGVGQFNDNELVLETLRKARIANPDAITATEVHNILRKIITV